MIDVISLVEQLDSRGILRANRVIGDYYQVYCPVHGGGQEKRASAGILLREQVRQQADGSMLRYPAGWFNCFACGGPDGKPAPLPDLITYILQSRSITSTGLDWLNKNIPGFQEVADFEYLLPQGLSQDLIFNWSHGKDAVEYLQRLISPNKGYISETELASYRFNVPYMYERKLTDDIIAKFDVGFHENWVPEGRKQPTPCITFPVKDHTGNVLFIYRRSIKSKFFSMPEGVQKPVYGLWEVNQFAPNIKRVIIVESILNALTCWVYGQPAVALMGTGNATQFRQLRESGIKEFVIGFDPDEAGRRATTRIKRALKDVAIIWEYEGIPPNKDINDLSSEEFHQLALC